jgi:hypothetical protein
MKMLPVLFLIILFANIGVGQLSEGRFSGRTQAISLDSSNVREDNLRKVLLESLPTYNGIKATGFESSFPHAAIGIPLAISSAGAAFYSFTSNGNSGSTNIVLGIVSSALAVYWIEVALRSETWIVYSNGMKIRVEYTL